MAQEGVLLLNSDYSPLGVISWKKAIKLMCKNKVEVIKLTQRVIKTAEDTFRLILPSIIRLIKFIRYIYKAKVPYNKRNILIRDGFTCMYCGKSLLGIGASIDHVLPRSLGGKSTFENSVACCVPCNSKKDNRTCTQSGMFPKRRPYSPTINEFILIQIKKLGLDRMLTELGL